MKDYLFNDFVYNEGYIWFYSGLYGIIEKCNIFNELTTEIVDVGKRQTIIDSILMLNDKLYALDMSGSSLIIYDTKIGVRKEVKLPCNNNYKENYFGFVIYKSDLVIFPKYQNNVYFFDINEETYRIRSYENNLQSHFCSGYRQNDIYYAISNDKMWCFNLDKDTFEIEIKELEIDCGTIVDYSRIEDKIFMLNSESQVYIWNLGVTKIDNYITKKIGEVFIRIEATKKGLVFLPKYNDGNIYTYDYNELQMKKYNDYPIGFRYEAFSVWDNYRGKHIIKDKTFYAMRSSNYMLVIDKNSGELLWKKPRGVPSRKILEALLSNRGYAKENEIINIDDYLLCVLEEDKISVDIEEY